jgi:hypothetical protein
MGFFPLVFGRSGATPSHACLVDAMHDRPVYSAAWCHGVPAVSAVCTHRAGVLPCTTVVSVVGLARVCIGLHTEDGVAEGIGGGDIRREHDGATTGICWGGSLYGFC